MVEAFLFALDRSVPVKKLNGFPVLDRIIDEAGNGYQTVWRHTMKKVILGIMTGVFAVSVFAATAFAAGPRCGHHAAYAGGSGCAYVDANGDGICDNRGTYHRGYMAGTGCAYVDANGDGICDSCGAYRQYHMAGSGCGGYYFVDADGDGICDHYGLGQGHGRGHGHSRCGRGW